MRNRTTWLIAITLIIIKLILNSPNTQPPTQRANPFISPINSPMAADTTTTSPLAAPLKEGENSPSLVNGPPNSPPPKPKKLPKVKLDRPRLGATTISGHGPVGLPIKIYEVAKTADLLCITTIDQNGQFICEDIPRPLRRNERVAVTAPDLSNTPYTRQDLRKIRQIDIPTYGYILDERKVR